MKKIHLSLTLILIMGMFSHETRAQNRFELGIRGGINFASFSDSKQEVDSRRVGLLAGVYGTFNVPLAPISIQPEVLYSQKGANINGVKVKLSYIEIPLLVKFNLSKKSPVTPHLYAGSYVGFKLNYKEEPSGDGEIKANNTDYGLVFGASIDIHKINLGARYSLGLNEIFDVEEERNNVIAVVAGFGF